MKAAYRKWSILSLEGFKSSFTPVANVLSGSGIGTDVRKDNDSIDGYVIPYPRVVDQWITLKTRSAKQKRKIVGFSKRSRES